jgi:hypothetical protein
MLGNFGVDCLAPMGLEPLKRSLFVSAHHQPRISRDIGGKNGGKATESGHSSGDPLSRQPYIILASAAIDVGTRRKWQRPRDTGRESCGSFGDEPLGLLGPLMGPRPPHLGKGRLVYPS